MSTSVANSTVLAPQAQPGTPEAVNITQPDPTARVLTRDEIRLAVKAGEAESTHHSVREYLEAGGVGIGILGAGGLLLSTYLRRRTKSAAAPRRVAPCR